MWKDITDPDADDAVFHPLEISNPSTAANVEEILPSTLKILKTHPSTRSYLPNNLILLD